MYARVRSHRCIAWVVWHGACSEAGPGAQGEYGGTETREGSWHSPNTHTHTHPTLGTGKVRRCVLWTHSHSCQAGICFQEGVGVEGPHRVQGYLSQLGPCCSLCGDNSTKLCPGFMTPFLSRNMRPLEPTPTSAPGYPGLHTPTSGSLYSTFPGRQHQNKRWGCR